MAGSKGFRNLPKLERLKRGRLAPGSPPVPRGTGRPPEPRPVSPSAVLSLSALPSFHRTVLVSLADILVLPSPALSPAGEEGKGEGAFLVGGAVRDLLLSRGEVEDLDFAVPSGAVATAGALARRLDGTLVVLDEARGAARVVLAAGAEPRQVDVTDLRAETLEADLRRRDFTVNAMAVSVGPLVRDGAARVIDPTGGRGDLARRRLRLAGPRALEEDPLRALRGVRLEAELGFALDAASRRAVRAAAARFSVVALERVREELIRLLRLPRATRALRELDRLGLLEAIVPEIRPMKSTLQPEPHRFSVWEHSLRTVEAIEALLGDLSALTPYGEQLGAHLAEPLGDGLARREALKLAALLHDVAKPGARQVIEGEVRFIGHDVEGAAVARGIGQRLKLSGRAVAVVAGLVRHHLRLMHLAQVPEITRRARYRFFRDLGSEARDLLVLSLADAAAVRGGSPFDVWRGPGGRLVAEFLSGWEEDRARVSTPPLLRGDDVMAVFGVAPGPAVGRLLARAREAQDLGLVASRDEAIEYLRGAPAEGLDSPEAPH